VSAGDALDAAVRVDVDLDVDGEVGEHHASAVRDIAQVVAEAAPDRQRQELATVEPETAAAGHPIGPVDDDRVAALHALRRLRALHRPERRSDDRHAPNPARVARLGSTVSRTPPCGTASRASVRGGAVRDSRTLRHRAGRTAWQRACIASPR
jgi:hypothetical protein